MPPDVFLSGTKSALTSHSSVPWREAKGGAFLHIALTPKSSRDAIGVIQERANGTVLRAYVRAIPDKGKANQALIKLLSKWLDVPKSSLEISSGSRSKLKTIKIYGVFSEISKQLAICVKPRSND